MSGNLRDPFRTQAEYLAHDAPTKELAAVFESGGSAGYSDELRAMIVHELVLTRHDVANHPLVGRWARGSHWRHHGLGWLPLELTEFERSPGPRGARFEQGWEALLAGRSVDAAGRTIEFVETTTDDYTDRAAQAFAHWAKDSNGKIDAHEYLAADAVRDDDLRDLLVHAAPAFLGTTHTLRAIPATLTQAWLRLYQAGSAPSYYGSSPGGAHGRLYAWQSIAALTGAPVAATPDDIARLARTCRWFALDVTSAWFWDAWWVSDVALACIGPEPERVAVIAATGTD
ncbi:DUF6183 family protein [Promicromonospora sp. NPDC057488]|uniref:DUF6183 family protein n=1 Tax=Promicromonospora sp. NPDC057488 TaxID=3346147 RepID=UPI0036703735